MALPIPKLKVSLWVAGLSAEQSEPNHSEPMPEPEALARAAWCRCRLPAASAGSVSPSGLLCFRQRLDVELDPIPVNITPGPLALQDDEIIASRRPRSAADTSPPSIPLPTPRSSAVSRVR